MRRQFLLSMVLLSVVLIFLTMGSYAVTLDVGTGSFTYEDSCVPLRPVKVFYHLPEVCDENSPIVFVMHGMTRSSEGYREPWIPLAEKHGFILVLPEFSKELYPGGLAYNLGHVTTVIGIPRCKKRWTFSQVERLFDVVKEATGNTSERYYIYGHSAGGQFVHRMVIFLPDARIKHAVAANAGWYTMPTFSTFWPYGLALAPLWKCHLGKVFETRMTILLGDQDNDPDHPQLNRALRAMRQGEHRLARGHSFFETASSESREIGVELNWDIKEVPGVGHSNAGMAPAAAATFFNP